MSAYEPTKQTAAEIFELALASRKALTSEAIDEIAGLIEDPEFRLAAQNKLREFGNDCYQIGVDAGISGFAANMHKWDR